MKSASSRRDIILQVNKVKITSLKEYEREISNKGAKSNVMLLIKRGQSTFFVAIRR